MSAQKTAKRPRAGGKGIHPAITIGIILLCFAGLFYFGRYMGWWGGAGKATGWTVSITNSTSDALENDEALAYIYRYEKPDAWDQDKFDALTLSVFTLDKVLEHGETYTPALSTYVYIMIVNGSGYNQQQYYMNPVALGTVAIQMLPTPTAAYINGLSTKGGATLNQTNDNNWRIFIQNVDADYEISDNYGYRTTLRYDSMDAMENILDYTTYNVIEWDTNSTTMTTSDIKIVGAQPLIRIAGDKVQFCFTEDFSGMLYKDFQIGSGLGGDFEIEGIDFKHGLLSSLSSIDTAV